MVSPRDRQRKWWIGFNMPGDTSQDEVRAELEPFAASVAVLGDATIVGGPAAVREIALSFIRNQSAIYG